MARNTVIDGIGQCEMVDSSGEKLLLEGIDTTSMTQDGVANWEHGSKDNPVQVVGKIKDVKKIFKKSDCENDRHEYYWNKVETPYLYVKVELLDGVGHEGAKQIVSMLKYDKDHKTDKERNMVNFSIEGAKLDHIHLFS